MATDRLQQGRVVVGQGVECPHASYYKVSKSLRRAQICETCGEPPVPNRLGAVGCNLAAKFGGQALRFGCAEVRRSSSAVWLRLCRARARPCGWRRKTSGARSLRNSKVVPKVVPRLARPVGPWHDVRQRRNLGTPFLGAALPLIGPGEKAAR
jgi:hypothetical protein